MLKDGIEIKINNGKVQLQVFVHAALTDGPGRSKVFK
jgi:hypothetical protein